MVFWVYNFTQRLKWMPYTKICELNLREKIIYYMDRYKRKTISKFKPL
jgi:hypothetical protein